ncbi:hypothetical protein [Amycolatopsis sp. lyj-112]|uniref:hypothetical protein n=1 Tax=Amycolatopsis sp. lyj-112 TaxID=2789288 RepID=UPI00397DCD95
MQKLVLDGIPVFAQWRRRVRREMHEQGSRGALRFLLALAPPARYFPDFLTPSGRRVRTRVDNDRMLRSRWAGEGGALGLLESLRPDVPLDGSGADRSLSPRP